MKHEDKLRRVIQLQAEIEARKAAYDELDRLTLELQSNGFVSAEVDGLVMELVNNFLSTNTVFRVAGVKQYEIKVVRPKKTKGA